MRSLDNRSIGRFDLMVKVTPNASKNQITQILDDGTIKVSLTSPPVEGKANAMLIKLLSDVFNVPVSNIQILRGVKSRIKHVRVIGIDDNTARQYLLSLFHQ